VNVVCEHAEMLCVLLVSVCHRQILFFTNSSLRGQYTCPKMATMN